MLLVYLCERELGNKKNNNFIYNYTLYAKMMCKNTHIYGYSPHLYNGECRFCLGNRPLTFPEFIKRIHF